MNYEDVVNQEFEQYGGAVPEKDVPISKLAIDSLELVQFCLDLEERLKIEIENQDISNLKMVGDIYNLVRSKIRARGHLWPGCPSPTAECNCGYSEVFWKDHNERIFYE